MRQAGNATFQLLLSPGVNCPAVSLTQSGKGRSGAPLLAQGHKLLWEHGVAALRHEAGPESGALLSHGAGARRQLLKPFDGLQRKSQAIFLPDEAFCQRETLNGLMLVAYGGAFTSTTTASDVHPRARTMMATAASTVLMTIRLWFISCLVL